MPVHPDVVQFFDLAWYDDKNTYFGREDITFNSYMWRYLTLDPGGDAPTVARDPKPFRRELTEAEIQKVEIFT